jgi:uncharacterized delta-60 repeat protein
MSNRFLRIFLSRALFAPVFCLFLSVFAAAQQGGALDPSFGGGDGRVISAMGGAFQADDIAVQIIDGQTKIVAAGYRNTGKHNDFAVLRFNEDGSPDTSFGAMGFVAIDFSAGKFLSDEQATSVVIQPDNKIVVVGTGLSFEDFIDRISVARLNPDGSLDGGFGGGGKVVTVVREESEAHAATIQADGKIVVAGTSKGTGFDYRFAVVRYLSNGTPDPDFGTNGSVVTQIAGANYNIAYAVAAQSDNKIIAAGTSGNDFAVVRYEEDGDLDVAFDQDGIVKTNFLVAPNSYDEARAIALQPSDGKIVVAGYAQVDKDINWAVARYNTDGSLDSGFSQDGKDIPIEYDEVFGEYISIPGEISDVVIQTDGKIVVGGEPGVFSPPVFKLTRYNVNGTQDATFGTEGVVKFNFEEGSTDVLKSLTLQPDGKILAGGSSAPASMPEEAGAAGKNQIGSGDALALARLLPYAVSAAGVSVGGRVTSPGGQGLSKVSVTIFGGALPQPVTVQTNAFGYYSFEGIPAGETYVLTVNSKRYVFAAPSRILNVSDAVTDADFVSVE